MAKKSQRKPRFTENTLDALQIPIFGLEMAQQIQEHLEGLVARPKEWTAGVVFKNSRTGDQIRTWGK